MRTRHISDATGMRAPAGRSGNGDGDDPTCGGRDLVAVIDVSEGWQAAARCRGHDATLFFGPNRFEPKHERIEREARAKAVCSTCPVLGACREHALATGELYGVWGGLGEADRRALLDRQRVARAV